MAFENFRPGTQPAASRPTAAGDDPFAAYDVFVGKRVFITRPGTYAVLQKMNPNGTPLVGEDGATDAEIRTDGFDGVCTARHGHTLTIKVGDSMGDFDYVVLNLHQIPEVWALK